MRKKPRPPLAKIVETFFRQRLVAQRKASPHTIEAYKTALRLLFIFVAECLGKVPATLSLDNLSCDIVLKFLDYCEDIRNNSVRTRNARLAAIKSFFQFAGYKDPAAMGHAHRIMQIPSKRAVRKVICFLSVDELNALYEIPNTDTPFGLRDHALLLFIGRTGARVTEVTLIRWHDLRLDRPRQALLYGKGAKERMVPLDEKTTCALEEWRKQQRADTASAPVFTNARGSRLTCFGVGYILNKAVKTLVEHDPKLARLHVTPHTLRHSNAMHMLQAGVDLTTIRSWLGHVNVDTTHHYVDADMEMKQRAIDKCIPPNTTTGRFIPMDELLALLDRI